MKLLVRWDNFIGENGNEWDSEIIKDLFNDIPNGIYEIIKEENEVKFKLERTFDPTQTQLEKISIK